MALPNLHRENFAVYGGRDPRYLPAYSTYDVARYLNIPQATLHSWVKGRHFQSAGKSQFAKPLIDRPHSSSQLSFINLVEAHVLNAIRRNHKISLRKVRSALDFLKRNFNSEHPLAENTFETDRIHLFIQKYGQLINASQDGQLAMRELLEAYLHRIDRDISGGAIRLYPFTRNGGADEPRAVVIDPFISFGKPVLAGTGIPTAVIAERYKAGENIDELSDDYGRQRSEIEEAIRCELDVAA
jgi:uncharacterized protein (DUF433 family)